MPKGTFKCLHSAGDPLVEARQDFGGFSKGSYNLLKRLSPSPASMRLPGSNRNPRQGWRAKGRRLVPTGPQDTPPLPEPSLPPVRHHGCFTWPHTRSSLCNTGTAREHSEAHGRSANRTTRDFLRPVCQSPPSYQKHAAGKQRANQNTRGFFPLQVRRSHWLRDLERPTLRGAGWKLPSIFACEGSCAWKADVLSVDCWELYLLNLCLPCQEGEMGWWF